MVIWTNVYVGPQIDISANCQDSWAVQFYTKYPYSHSTTCGDDSGNTEHVTLFQALSYM